MTYCFRNFLFVTTCFMVSLGCSYPAFSMEQEEKGEALNKRPKKKKSKKPVATEENSDWKDSLFKETPFFDPEFQIGQFEKLYADPKKKTKLLEILEVEAFVNYHKVALEKVYALNKDDGKLVGKEKADKALNLGVERYHDWAFQAIAAKINKPSTPQQEKIKLHCILANHDYKGAKSEDFLDKLPQFNFYYDIKNWQDVFWDQNKYKIFFNNVGSLGYYKPFHYLFNVDFNIQTKNEDLISRTNDFKNERKLTFLKKAADLGFPKYILLNANKCLENKEYKEASKYFIKLAYLGNPRAMECLGGLYEVGLPTKDLREAKKWYARAAQLGNSNSMLKLGNLYQNYGQPDLKAAEYWYTQAIQKGCAEAMRTLGLLYEQGGHGIAKDLTKAFELYFQAAEKGNADAMNKLGYFYKNGIVVERNFKKAEEWYKRAIELNYVGGMNNLGCLYLMESEDFPKNPKKAMEWFKKAADFGLKNAIHNIGAMLFNGYDGEDPDKEAALSYFHKAAEKGVSNSMCALAICYLEEDKYDKVFFWVEKAKTLGDPQAIYLYKQVLEKLEENISTPEEDEKLIKCLEEIEKSSLSFSTKSDISPSLTSLEKEEVTKKEEKSLSDEGKEFSENLNEKAKEEQVGPKKKPLTSFKKIIQNPKTLRENLRKGFKVVEEMKKGNKVKRFSKESHETIQVLQDPQRRHKIELKNLQDLIDDDYFGGQIEITKLSDGGLKFCAYVFSNNNSECLIATTHINHDQNYDGFNRKFILEILKILERFGI